MTADKISLLGYLLLPFAAALMPGVSGAGGLFSKGSAATVLRILLLLALGRTMLMLNGVVEARAILVEGYPLDIVLSLNVYRYGFLLTAEFCFLLAHWMCPVSGRSSGMIRVLVGFAQGLCSLLVLSENSAATGALLLLAGTVFFYLVRFALPPKDEQVGATISTRMHVLFFLLGVLMISWGIAEFSGANLAFGRGSNSTLGLALWLALVIASIPMPPWSRWFNGVVEHLPEGVTLTVVIFLSGLALKLASLFSVAYPDLGWKQKLLLYVLGILGCCLSIAGLFAAETRRRMLGCLPSFFLSLVLVSVGVSRSGLVLSAYFVCLFVPVFTGLVLSATAMNARGMLQRVFVALLFVLVLGLPGTPVYQIFSGIGARSLDLGIGYTIVFGLLWFFYFNANVHLYRRIFTDPAPVGEAEEPARLEGAPGFYAGYGVFLM
ncbi:MAG: hypothetical protein ACXWR1_19260, partial [Bdellovibrionota bacterium]